MTRWAGVKKAFGRLAAGDRRRRVVVLLAAFILVATLAAIFISRQVAIAGLRRDITHIETSQTEATAQQKELRTDLASTTNAKALEEEARRKLGLVRPGEEKAFFVEEGDSP